MEIGNRILNIVLQKKWMLLLYIAIAVGITVQLLIEQQTINSCSFNNFKIFKYSFNYLLAHQNLYLLHPESYFDLFKYSPSFAALMFPFYYLPNWVGLLLWNLLNALVLFYSVFSLKNLAERKQSLILLFSGLELISSLQNSQSNALLIGLLIYSFSFFETRKMAWAALFIVLAFYLKVFGAAIFIMFLFYPDKIKFLLFSAFWCVLILIFPLFFVSNSELIWQYKNWFTLLLNDQQTSYGVSIMGLLHSWLHLDVNKTLAMLFGLALLIYPFFKTIKYNSILCRINFFSALVLWMIVFNHRSESATFIIALVATALWYFSNEKTKLNTMLTGFVFIFSSLITTDIIPFPNKQYWLSDMALKVFPCLLIWLKIMIDFYFQQQNKSSVQLS